MGGIYSIKGSRACTCPGFFLADKNSAILTLYESPVTKIISGVVFLIILVVGEWFDCAKSVGHNNNPNLTKEDQ